MLPALPERPIEPSQALDAVKPMAVQREAPSASLTLLQMAEEHLKNQLREGLPIKTLDDKRAVATLCARIIGDLPVDQITRKHAHQFKETALKLPPRMHQLPVQPLEKVIAEAKTTISLTTFNNYVKNLTTFLTTQFGRATARGIPSTACGFGSGERPVRSAVCSPRMT